MNIDKLISPFAEDAVFTEPATLLKAFSQKASAEGWTNEEIKYVVDQAAGRSLAGVVSLILTYTDFNVDDWRFADMDDEDTEEEEEETDDDDEDDDNTAI